MSKVRVSAISYLNTIPFIYGLQNSSIMSKIDMAFDVPSTCAKRLLNNTADIGIVPVVVVPALPEYHIISNYCIGSVGKVRTVALFSNSEINKIKTVYLDKDSRTSAMLAQILAHKYWKISPEFKPLDAEKFDEKDAAFMLIGDKAFEAEKQFSHTFDLGEEWYKFKKIPFVFATWTANKKLDEQFLYEFNSALTFGVNNTKAAVEQQSNGIDKKTAIEYFEKYISYDFDSLKRQGLTEFWNLALEEIKRDRVR
ncbi:MAG: menaquinone biosynthesis protein [Prevotellaceae bacterium]|jgi:chorismate dehydratase|nr:menaquinone biosynthesis protein [Prevotellaceae bacterium]